MLFDIFHEATVFVSSFLNDERSTLGLSHYIKLPLLFLDILIKESIANIALLIPKEYAERRLKLARACL
jgi:hypothetical protein